jgi:hypothetical protein
MTILKTTAATLATTASLVGLALSASDEGRKLDLATDKAYEHVVAPILNKTCYGCHGEKKAKGKFRLHTPEEITKSETIVASKPDESTMIERIFLPADDEDVMPPEDKTPLTEDEKQLLNWWIASGADFEKTIAQAGVTEDIAPLLVTFRYTEPKMVEVKKAFDLPEPNGDADAAAVAAIEKAGVLIMPLAQDTKYLSANALNVAKSFNDAQVKMLTPVASHLTWLDVARTGITDAAANDLGQMTKLTKLHLENTAVTDATLAQFGALSNLEYLNLYGTKITDAGIAQLKGLKKLKKLYVWQTGVTDAGAKALQDAIPGLEVNMGWKAPAAEPKKEDKPAEPKK